MVPGSGLACVFVDRVYHIWASSYRVHYGYSFIRVSRSQSYAAEGVDVPDVITRYKCDTPDAQATILKYYHDLVLQKGFVPSSRWGGAISADAYYLRKGCPPYGVLIAVDAITQHVVIEFSRNPCMY